MPKTWNDVKLLAVHIKTKTTKTTLYIAIASK
jgi:hypothetical protein